METRSCASATIAAFVCAIPLAAACGNETPAAQPAPRASTATPRETPRAGADGATPRLRARLELPLAGAAHPVGVVCLDTDGDGRDEIVVATRTPGTVQLLSGVDDAFRAPPEPRVLSIDDFPLGPVRVGTGTLVAVTPRTNPTLLVVDAAKLATDPEHALVWKLELEQRARAIAAGDLGHDGTNEIVIVTLEDVLLVVRDGKLVARTELPDAQTTCVRVADDGSCVYVGFQATREIARYEPDPADAKKLVRRGAAHLDWLPRAIDEIHGSVVVAGGDHDVWGFTPELDRHSPRPNGGAIPIALAHAVDVSVVLALQGQTATLLRKDDSDPRPFELQAGQHPLACALGHLRRPDEVDLAIANVDASRVSVVFDAPSGSTTARVAATGRSPHALAIGDLDGDGRPDVVALTALDGRIGVLRGSKDGLGAWDDQGGAPSADSVQLADVDGDGHLDALLVRATEAGCVLDAWFGDGHGRLFQRAEVEPLVVSKSKKPGGLAIVELPGTSELAALGADPDGDRVWLAPIRRVARPGPGARFDAPIELAVAGGPKALVRTQSGALAVSLSRSGPRAGVAWLAIERGTSGAWSLVERSHVAAPEPVIALASADFDGDGHADLALLGAANDGPGAVHVLLGGADGAWTMLDPLVTGLRPYAVRAADLDGDGRAEIVVSAQNSHHVNVWRSTGDRARLFERCADLGSGTGPLGVELADLDGDGVPEIVVACSFSNEVAVVRVR